MKLKDIIRNIKIIRCTADPETEIDDNRIYELPPVEAEWTPVEETVGSGAKAETESPKED